jgi:hypothetical protein
MEPPEAALVSHPGERMRPIFSDQLVVQPARLEPLSLFLSFDGREIAAIVEIDPRGGGWNGHEGEPNEECET